MAIADAGGRCLAHLASDELDSVLQGLGTTGVLDVRGVEISAELVQRILIAAPPGRGGRPQLTGVDATRAVFGNEAKFDRVDFGDGATFEGAAFGSDVSFVGVSFGDDASFDGAIFGDRLWFDGATFRDRASFDRVRFGEEARFQAVTFGHAAWFGGATFGRGARFGVAQFSGGARFDRATFANDALFVGARFGEMATFSGASFGDRSWFELAVFGDAARFDGSTFGIGARFGGAAFGYGAMFRGATFDDEAWFEKARFGEDSDFSSATFHGQVRFDGAIFAEGARFDGAVFQRALVLGPMLVLGRLSLDATSFLQPVDIEVSARQLTTWRARFPAGVRLRARWAEIALDQCTFGGPSVIVGSPRFGALKDRRLVETLKRDGIRSVRTAKPRVVSLRGANVADLTLSNLDLRACRFSGAQNLDGLHIGADCNFSQTPPGRRYTRRETLAEEQEWRYWRSCNKRMTRLSPRWIRSSRRDSGGWYASEVQPPDWLELLGKTEQLEPEQIAPTYRSLRKGREDTKDTPGAADFYYGEMEMRRHSQRRQSERPRGRFTRDRGERAVLTLYWLVSGYGLRASRALVALVVTVLTFALALWGFGFDPRPGFIRSVLFSVGSTSSLFRVPETPGTSLTDAGEAMQILLRLLGPLFFGLALLALRGRVKR